MPPRLSSLWSTVATLTIGNGTPKKEHAPRNETKLDQLPIETIQAIMCCLTDAASLRAVALTCTTFYKAFLSAESLIIPKVVLNDIGTDVLPEAMATLEASKRFSPAGIRGEEEYIANTFRHRKLAPLSWTMADAVALSKMSLSVHYFAEWFATDKLEFCSDSMKIELPSAMEMARIERALYRFQICCFLFPMTLPAARWRQFLFCFSPWELEQLASVRDFLYEVILPAYNEIMEHDVTCGAVAYGPEQNNASGEVEWILAQGLGKLHSICEATTYEDRYRMINPLIWSNHFFGNDWLYKAFSIPLRFDNGHPLGQMDQGDWDMYVRRPFFEEPDKSAWRAWKLLHDNDSADEFVNSYHHTKVRQAGYVFWDWERVDMNHFRLLMSVPQVRDWTELEIKQKEEAEESRRIRSKIFAKGGRGYWSFEDESKIIWTNPNP